MTELAFLRAFLAWENFLEESFILYLAGHRPPRGRSPRRYTYPPTLKQATEWVVPEGRRDFAEWATASTVSNRAQRFFAKGGPFTDVLDNNQNTLDESKILRNAIAHMSAKAQAKFEAVARNKLGSLPLGLTVGGLLSMTVPSSTPPCSFLDHYLSKVELAAKRIVPT